VGHAVGIRCASRTEQHHPGLPHLLTPPRALIDLAVLELGGFAEGDDPFDAPTALLVHLVLDWHPGHTELHGSV
jgi:hypothetical protein